MPIASLAAVRYKKGDNPFFAWLGLYIVQYEYRHRGYGKALWDHAKSQLEHENYKTFGLHAVMNQIETYQKDGFEVPHDKAKNTRWMGVSEKQKFHYRKSGVEIVSLKDILKLKPSS